MNRDAIITLSAAVIVMLCLGGIYAWSLYVPFLINDTYYSTWQTQLIFGGFIGVFTLSMVFTRSLLSRYGPRVPGMIAAGLYGAGYLIGSISGLSFWWMLMGVTFLSGVATGFGYLISVTVPVEWFPERKGLVTGLVSAGFGGGAILESIFFGHLIEQGLELQKIFLIIGFTKGGLLLLMTSLFKRPVLHGASTPLIPLSELLRNRNFKKLLLGIFTGTFAGLLVIGNLQPIGLQYDINVRILFWGITVFSVANFTGRLFWGWLNDLVSGILLVKISLFLIGTFTFLIGFIPLSPYTYLIFTFVIGFSYGANFVIYANETIRLFGLTNLSKIYPLVFLGYGFSGITGPFTGGFLRDVFNSYQYPAIVAFALCMLVLTFIVVTDKKQKTKS